MHILRSLANGLPSMFMEKAKEIALELGLVPRGAQQQQIDQQAADLETLRQSQKRLLQSKARNRVAQQHAGFILGREYIDQLGVRRRTEGLMDIADHVNF
jgi:hypothetical protein